LQCKDILDRPILEFLAKRPDEWHNWYFVNQETGELDEKNVQRAMSSGLPQKLVVARWLK
jgi:hypothetical protein